MDSTRDGGTVQRLFCSVALIACACSGRPADTGSDGTLRSDGASPGPADRCTRLGTWGGPEGDRGNPFTSIGWSRIAGSEGVLAQVIKVEGADFSLDFDNKQFDFVNYVEAVKELALPFAVGDRVHIAQCYAGIWDPRETGLLMVIREPSGELLFAGGAGPGMPECIPAELVVSLVDKGCPAIEGMHHCGPRRNVGIAVTHNGKTVVTWPGHSNDLVVGGKDYRFHNWYSFVALGWQHRCLHYIGMAMSWAIVRR